MPTPGQAATPGQPGAYTQELKMPSHTDGLPVPISCPLLSSASRPATLS